MNSYENIAALVRERINLLLRDKGLTQNAVAAGDKPAQKRLNSQLSHGAGITLDTILRIIDACPDVSLDWLLRGVGSMYTTNIDDATIEQNRPEKSGMLSESFVRELLSEKDKQIQTLLQLIR